MALLLAFGAVAAHAQEGSDGALDADFFTPEERAARERERKRKAQPVLSCRPAKVRARVLQGGSTKVRLTVRNTGGGTLNWSVKSAPEWARIDTMEGSVGFGGEQALTFTIAPAKLKPGKLTGELVIEAPDAAGSPLTVPIALEIAAPPRLVRDPADDLPNDVPDLVAKTEAIVPNDRSAGLKFGVRTGYLAVASTERSDGAAALLGAYLSKPTGGRVSWEAGIDFARPEADDGAFTSTLVSGRFDVLFPLGDATRSGGTRPYLLSGASGIVESAEEAGKSYTNSAAAVNFGAGARFGDKFDVRVTYSLILGSENSSALILLSAGMTF